MKKFFKKFKSREILLLTKLVQGERNGKKNLFLLGFAERRPSHFTLLLRIAMHALSGRGQEVDPIPAHLQQQKDDDESRIGRHGRLTFWTGAVGLQPQMHIEQTSTPCGGGPSLFGVPGPIVAPCLFGPDASRKHAEGEEKETDADETIGRRQINLSVTPKTDERHEETTTEEAV